MHDYAGHTPGPWKIRNQDDDLLIVMDDDDALSWCEVCQVAEQREQKANARLIAAAPQLLADLNEAVGLLREVRERIGPGRCADQWSQLAETIDTFLSRLDAKGGK